MNTTHIIFDLDGTLVDTIEDIALAMNRALAAHGFTELPLESYPALVGWGIHRLAEQALAKQPVRPDLKELPSADPAMADRIAQDALKNYDEEPLRYSKPYPGIKELLDILVDKNLVLAVLTNKPDPVARQVVAGLFPHIPFALVRGDLPGGQIKKPDPALTRDVMEVIGAPPDHTLFVGDSVVDVQTARNVGCPIVGVAWGFRGPEELVAAGADYIIHEAKELLAIL
ncbi:HAD family hydrolase [Gracilinema caldarium]|uniref:HAD family hydrolase n=1 Tax=Gracilinema caldarium TaxID=215591 RepID=UPI0026F30A5D|nr:HAD family hydrolase [Gracilinema caldarium]